MEQASQYDYEWVVPNSTYGKYFTTTQARMYIGNLFIDEFNSVQFAYQGNRIPVYGYCSEDLDALGTGKRLVQGQILINFISEGYLYTVLSEYARMIAAKTQAATAETEAGKKIAELEYTRAALVEHSMGALASTSLPAYLSQGHVGWAPGPEAGIEAIDAEIIRLGSLGPGAVDEARRVMDARDRLKTTSNAIALKIPFDIVMELEGGGRTVTRKLEGCVLTSNEQIYDQSGVTLADAYGFVARRLI